MEIDLVGDGVFLGREPGATLALPYPDISGLHARLLGREGVLYFEDLGSTNGSYAGERRLLPHVPLPVGVGERLRLGAVEVRIEAFGEALPRAPVPEGSASLARRLVADLFQACAPAEPTAIRVEAGVDAGKSLALLVRDRRYVVGRGPTCDLIVSDPDVSREHVAFLRTDEGIHCLDLGSKNGVRRAGAPVSLPCRGRDGDRFTIGGTTLCLVDPEDRYLRQMEAIDAAAEPARREPADPEDLATSGASGAAASSEAAFALPTLTPPPTPSPSRDFPSGVAPSLKPGPRVAKRSILPFVVGGVASVVLLGLIGVVLALAFDFWK